MEGIARVPYNYAEEWFFVFILIIMGLYATARISFHQPIGRTLRFYLFGKVENTDSAGKQFRYTVFNILAIANISFFLMLLELDNRWLGWNQSSAVILLLTALVITLYWTFRYIIDISLGYIFRERRTFAFFIYSWSEGLRLCGAVLIPVNILIAYQHRDFVYVYTWLGWAIIAAFSTVRIIQCTRAAQSHKVSFTYILLYLCTLEIAPVLTLVKWVGKN